MLIEVLALIVRLCAFRADNGPALPQAVWREAIKIRALPRFIVVNLAVGADIDKARLT